MNFIIYDDREALIRVYKEVIFHVMSSLNINYNVIIYKESNDCFKDNKEFLSLNNIYIINVEFSLRDSINLAMFIRGSGDWKSPIIAILKKDILPEVGYTGKMLMVDFVSNDRMLESHLKEMVLSAVNIIKSRKSISFSYRGESFLIPYDDVLYIEKQLNDNMSVIITNKERVCIPKSISCLEKELNDGNFVKTHRSCLVNVDKIKHIDYENRIIMVGDKKITLFSRSNKRIIKQKIEEYFH